MNQRFVTDEERRAYGSDLLSVIERQAWETLSPELQNLKRDNADLRARVQASEARDIYSLLDAEIPNWRAINVSEGFLDWLREQDVLSGGMKSILLRQAFNSGDAPRTLAFFRGYLDAHPQARAGRGASRTSGSRSFASDVPSGGTEWTTSLVKDFYNKVRTGYFETSDEKRAEKARIESNLEAAARAGKITRDSRA
jgi:hypothetical protein